MRRQASACVSSCNRALQTELKSTVEVHMFCCCDWGRPQQSMLQTLSECHGHRMCIDVQWQWATPLESPSPCLVHKQSCPVHPLPTWIKNAKGQCSKDVGGN
eukprot:5945989-Amphidinium_carterae.1